MDMTTVEAVIVLGVAAAATLGLAKLIFIVGVKMWNRIGKAG